MLKFRHKLAGRQHVRLLRIFNRCDCIMVLPRFLARPMTKPASENDDLRDLIVQAVIASVPDVMDGDWADRSWQQIVVNYETLLHSSAPQVSDISFSVAEDRTGLLEIVDFRLSRVAKDALQDLAIAMHAQARAWWTVCDLVIEADGRYRFDFGYDAPYRLSGQIDDQRFDDYLQRYLSRQEQ